MMMRMRTTMTRGGRGVRRIDRQAGPDHPVVHLNLAVVHSHIYTLPFDVVISEHKEYNWIYFSNASKPTLPRMNLHLTYY